MKVNIVPGAALSVTLPDLRECVVTIDKVRLIDDPRGGTTIVLIDGRIERPTQPV